MDRDHELDEYKGDVDFDFFDEDSSQQKPPSPRPNKSVDKVDSAKPPGPRRSPTPVSPVEDSVTAKSSSKHLSVNGNNRQVEQPSDRHESPSGSDSYSSDSDHTDTASVSESESSTFSDVSSVRSGTRARNRRRSLSNSSSSSQAHETSATRKQRRRSTSRDKNQGTQRKSRSPSQSLSNSVSDSDTDSYSDSDRTPSPTPKKNRRNVKFEKQPERRQMTPVKDDNRKMAFSKMRPGSAHPKRRENGVQREAWGNERNGKGKSSNLKKQNDRHKNGDDYDKDGHSLSDSDSDMTDVSPLNSPRNGPQRGRNDSQRGETSNRSHKRTVQYCAMPDDEPDRYPARRGGHETFDLNILMRAVSELEKKKRVKENTRRVMFAPPKKNDKSNYTFTDDRTRVIERENQRLLHEIMKHVAEQREPNRVRRQEPPQIRRPTPSAINRTRQQKKIEEENLALLRRLQRIKPTRGMAREEQITEYHRTMLHGVPMATAEEIKMARTRRSRPGSASSTMSQRSRSMSSVHSASTITSAASTVRSRPGSAKKFRALDIRPEWSDRW